MSAVRWMSGLLLLPPPGGSLSPDSLAEAAIASRVEIVRTEYGVPHILAEDFEAMGFGLAWVQSEDYGDVVARGMVQRRGEYGRLFGHDSIDGDFTARLMHARAAETFSRLEEPTRAVYAGFAAGVNYYIRHHPEDFPTWMTPEFTSVDAHALDVQTWSRGDAGRFIRDLERRLAVAAPGRELRDDVHASESAEEGAFELDGSNAWAFHPSRTTSGHAILLRNPHLSWDAGYYEAHVRIPGQIDFYGDFRIGGPFGIIGGFNRHLGWATTNNSPRYSQVYALASDPADPGRFLLDGTSHALEERSLTVDYRGGEGVRGRETRTTWWTRFGPVIGRSEGRIYVLKDPRDGEFRRGEQFLKMMRTRSLDAWIQVMHVRAHPSSNFTYADADGNIVHYYNARIPRLPHEMTGDTAAWAAASTDIWSELVPFEDLPLYLNPPGGYVQQANDTPDYTNLNVPMDRDTLPPNLPDPRLRPRSQLSLDLIHGEDRLSLEDVITRKHSPRMLVAERVVDDLVEAVRASAHRADVLHAADILEAWDRTAATDARGAVLFERWAAVYRRAVGAESFFQEPWTPERPMATPLGLGSPEQAVAALEQVVIGMRAEGLPLDVPWGDVHRVIRGRVDEPVAGCEGTLGCFRTLSFEQREDGRLAANRGDGWILAVEFGDVPRAYSILAYGQSSREGSPHYDDQAAMFARGRMKSVAFTNEQIAAAAVRRYRPGGPETP
ncbi:MAG: penicillin acylase family protein [Gemmatimonadota bacterium]